VTRIYETTTVTASEKLHRVTIGIVASCAAWLIIAMLGIPHIFGLEIDIGLIPFAILGAMLGFTRFHRVSVYGAFVLLVFLVVVAYTPVFDGPARSFVRSDPLPSSADAVVSLSAGLNADGILSRDGMERLVSALELVKRGIAPRLVVTHEERRVGGEYFTSTTDQLRLARLADVKEVITTHRVRSTHDEAVSVSQIAAARGWHHVVVVTNPYHTLRACRTFEKTGLIVTCVPSLTREIAVNHLSVPRDRINAFGLWLYETAGMLRYRQKGWV
jgi:uncharacterized SAM-binding protein YcdF (DUF218 family)